MSRHGYTDYDDDDNANWRHIMWRGRVTSAMRGKRGQAFFRDMIAALDAMPVKELHPINVAGDCVCAMGALAKHRGADVSAAQAELEDEGGDHEWATALVGDRLGIAEALALETAYVNDEGAWDETPAQRWTRMRRWAERHIRASEQNGA